MLIEKFFLACGISFAVIVNRNEIMSEENKVRLEILEMELETVNMLRRRAKDDALRAKLAAEREILLKAEIDRLRGSEVAA